MTLQTRFVSTFFALASLYALTACQTPNQPNSVPLAQVRAQLPLDWVSLQPDDWRMAYLDSPTRQLLRDMKKELADERASHTFAFNNGYSDATYAKIRDVNEACNKAFCANAVTIGKNLTPELAGTSLTVNEAYMNSTVVGDVNLRQMQDDWARLWLMNKPSSLSPYPIVNTGGRP
jgi:hypothetical protein